MIFVAAGTQDGRELVDRLLDQNYPVAASVVSHYGCMLLDRYPHSRLLINEQPLDKDGLKDYIRIYGIRLFVDASHPYAVNVSENAMSACKEAGIPYVRYERDLTKIDYPRTYVVRSYEEAAEMAEMLGKKVFLTTGSRNLKTFIDALKLSGTEVTARVLPTKEVLGICEQVGLDPGHIVAMQGPFSKLLNKEMFCKYQADVVVTKNSGSIGGTDTKLAAAEAADLPLIIIDRPVLDYPVVGQTYQEIMNFIKEQY